MLIPEFTEDLGLAVHTAVLDEAPGCTVSAWALPPDSAARRARHLLRSQLARPVGDRAVLDDLELMVCELGTNAATYADGPHELRILQHAGVAVVCEIADAGGGLDEIAGHLRRHLGTPSAHEGPFDIDALELGGRGLGVVARLSGGRCGVRTTRLCANGRLGKSVWFAIPVNLSNDAVCAVPPRAPRTAPGADVFLEVKRAAEPRSCGRF